MKKFLTSTFRSLIYSISALAKFPALPLAPVAERQKTLLRSSMQSGETEK